MADKIYTKIDDKTVKVIEEVSSTFNIIIIKQQWLEMMNDKDNMNQILDTKISELETLIAEAKKIGVE